MRKCQWNGPVRWSQLSALSLPLEAAGYAKLEREKLGSNRLPTGYRVTHATYVLTERAAAVGSARQSRRCGFPRRAGAGQPRGLCSE
jgi:hypothetical protein